MGIKVGFFDWNQSILDHAIAYLTCDWEDGLLDLSAHLIIVPSRHASRRLRERLAETAAQKKSAVLPGRIATPEILFHPKESMVPVVDSITTSLVWQQIIRELRADDMSHLFPDGGVPEEFSTRQSLARELIQLRALLCEEGYTIASFAENYTENPEPERWENLAGLETRYIERLKSLNLRDDCTEKIASSLDPVLDQEYGHISMLFTPDPPALAITALEKMAKQNDILIGIHAPESEAEHFDEWGRPLKSYWPESVIPVDDQQIHLSSTPQHQISELCAALSDLPEENRSSIAMGVPDSSLTPFLENQLNGQEIRTFDPRGKPIAETPLFGLIEALSTFLVEPTYDAFANLVRHPFMLSFFYQKLKNFKTITFLKQLDVFQNEHLPSDYDAIRSFVEMDSLLDAVVAEINVLLEILNQGQPAESLQPVLAEIFKGRTLRAASRTDKIFVESANILTATLESIRNTPVIKQLSSSECLQIIAQEFRQQRITADHPANAIDLLGWLELPWEDASHLILTGMADGKVPETIVGHIFLPDQARQEMKLRDNLRRFTRDAYLFKAMLMSRQAHGEVHIYCSKTTFTSDPLKPSRLLLMGEPDQLAHRVLRLFRKIPEQTTRPHRQIDWLLKPGPLSESSDKSRHISITALRDYLDCPFGYYLKRVRRMRERDDSKLELDAMDFGNICHIVLHLFAKSEVADSTDSKKIANFLKDTASGLFAKQYGTRLSLPLLIQLNTIHERLAQAACVQSETRKEGWKIIEAEAEYTLTINDWLLKGRIDRIDGNEEGFFRIIDYKTSNKSEPPETKHLRRVPHEHDEYRVVPDTKKYWVDLQLPLYQFLYAQKHTIDLERIQCGYFVLPKTSSSTAILTWEALETFSDSAQACTKEILKRIERQEFWPPQKIDRNRDFSFLFYDTAEESVQCPDVMRGGVSCE